jgi:hypothetical protein
MRSIVTITCLFFALLVQAQTPEQLAQRQLDAYNKRDIVAFMENFSDTVKVYNKMELLYKGADNMRLQYATMFQRMPELNCRLDNRIVVNDTVVDEEYVTFSADQKIRAIVMYKVAHSKIQEVHFLARVGAK